MKYRKLPLRSKALIEKINKAALVSFQCVHWKVGEGGEKQMRNFIEISFITWSQNLKSKLNVPSRLITQIEHSTKNKHNI